MNVLVRKLCWVLASAALAAGARAQDAAAPAHDAAAASAQPATTPAAQPGAATPAARRGAATPAPRAARSTAQTDAGEPRAGGDDARAGAGEARAGAGRKGPAAADRVDLNTATVTGDREQPKVMYIVPWKSSDIGDGSGKPMNSLLDEALAPVDRDEFKREVVYYGAVQSSADQKGEK